MTTFAGEIARLRDALQQSGRSVYVVMTHPTSPGYDEDKIEAVFAHEADAEQFAANLDLDVDETYTVQRYEVRSA